MNMGVWITGSLFALVAIQPARSQVQQLPQDSQNEAVAEQALRRAVNEEAHMRRVPPVQLMPKLGRLSPEERLKLRQDVSAASRNPLPQAVPTRY